MRAGGAMLEDNFIIRGIEFKSRFWIGTGKYKDFEETARVIEASGADVVTVAVRRVNIIDRNSPNLLDFIDPGKYLSLIHISEPTRRTPISYAVFCLKK